VEAAPLLIMAVLLPTAVGFAAVGAVRIWRTVAERRCRAAPPPTIQRLAADLRRLHAQLDAVELAPDLPAKHLRRDAVRAAYLDALGDACRRLEVQPPRAARTAEIYRVEDALRRRGLDVRAPHG
jgi:hypothetical protein